jgi:hypothetical protein
MRLLLLLSALLTSLCGVVSGAAFATVQVESSVAIAEQGEQVAANPVARFADGAVPVARARWQPTAAPVLTAARPLYADRLRE